MFPGLSGNSVARRFTATVANIDCAPVPTNANTVLTFTLPINFSAALLAAGVSGRAVAISGTNIAGLVFGPLRLATANTAICTVFNPTNAAIAAVNAVMQLDLYEPAGGSSGVATGAVT
jgi:hypothetical protein